LDNGKIAAVFSDVFKYSIAMKFYTSMGIFLFSPPFELSQFHPASYQIGTMCEVDPLASI
jgi:hypothetical protein